MLGNLPVDRESGLLLRDRFWELLGDTDKSRCLSRESTVLILGSNKVVGT